MTVAELIQQLLTIDDITKTVYVYDYEHSNLRELDLVDELSDRVDINIKEVP